jgi:hypothetical protein
LALPPHHTNRDAVGDHCCAATPNARKRNVSHGFVPKARSRKYPMKNPTNVPSTRWSPTVLSMPN